MNQPIDSLSGWGWETDDDTEHPTAVLYVEDDADLGEMVAEFLERHGSLSVQTATEANAGLEALDDSIDCVLSDFDMGGMNGLDFLDAVREEYPELPFILYTGKGSEEVAADAISAGVTDYIQKEGGSDHYQLLAQRIEQAVKKRRTERSLERTQRRLSKLIQHSTDIITVLGPDGRTLFQSPSVERILGYTPEEMVGESAFEYVHPEDEMRVLEAFDHGLDHPEELVEVEWRSKHAEGGWRWLKSIGKNRLEDPDVNGFVVNHRDITEQREREQQLEWQNERLDRFASVVSHDLRSPLDLARGYVEMAVEDDDISLLPKALDAHDRMETMIDDTLELARQGDVVDDPETVDLTDLIENAWSSIETLSATLEIEETGVLQADADRFQRLLENLFRNAITHGGEDVTVRIGIDGNAIYVADDGPGIDPGHRDTIFEFGETTAESGSGVGLAIVEEIAKAHQWAIEVEESEAGGAKFVITGVDSISPKPSEGN